MNQITIPNFTTLQLQHIVLDYNGTIATDGVLKESVKRLINELCKNFSVHIITADTFGSVAQQSQKLKITLKILASSDHTQEKADYINELGADTCVAIGNGNNDKKMLQTASLGIAVLGEEGCATETMLASDMVCKCIEDALELLTKPKRVVATLRK
jgi:P-type E1-E2 ATPase